MYSFSNDVQRIISGNFLIVLKVMGFPFLWFAGGTCTPLRLIVIPIDNGYKYSVPRKQIDVLPSFSNRCSLSWTLSRDKSWFVQVRRIIGRVYSTYRLVLCLL